MRKILLVPLVCATIQLHAQKSSWGIESGISVGNQREVYVENYTGQPTQTVVTFSHKNSVTAMVGVFYQFQFSKSFAVRSGLQHMENENSPRQAHLKYWTLPVSICYYANPRFNLNVGGYVSFLSNPDDSIPYFGSVSSLFSQNDCGINFGCEKTVYKNFAVRLNYFIGLRNVWLLDHTLINNRTSDEKFTNRILQFSLIYKVRKSM